jgi:hypothetical protein
MKLNLAKAKQVGNIQLIEARKIKSDFVSVTRLLRELAGMPCIQIRCAEEAFTQLASAEDVPPVLRSYYAKVGKKLDETEVRLKKYLRSAKVEGEKLSSRIHKTLGHSELTEEEMNRLRHVNTRLQDLEKILQQKIDGMHERLEGFDPAGVEWDEWDAGEIILWLRISTVAERPAYDPATWGEDYLMESLEIRVAVWERPRSDAAKVPWGLDDGQNHSDLGGCEGSQMQHFHQCYLFHELWDHADVGTWGMLNLRSIWIEVMPHRSGDFVV